ncbi:MAG: hypothetical protein HY430_02045 [Candidatus Levybacteria bacterium]|nr:hypothetical protein [Candidatus Levybacteria bacterium]
MSDHGVLGVLLEEQGLSTLGPLQCYDDLRVLESIFQSGKEAVQIDHWGGNVRIESIASAGEGLCRLRYIGDTLGI